MKFTNYFINKVMVERPYIKTEWVEAILADPVSTEVQSDGRVRYWGYVEEFGRYFRVITEPDGETVHNAFPDRRFRP